jgi:hypothetical protein
MRDGLTRRRGDGIRIPGNGTSGIFFFKSGRVIRRSNVNIQALDVLNDYVGKFFFYSSMFKTIL